VRDRRRDERRLVERGEVCEVDAVCVRVREVMRHLEREPGLATSAGAGERDQAHTVAAEKRADLLELAPAAYERRSGRGEMPPRAELGRLDAERRVLAEDRLLELLKLRPRLEAEIVAERAADTPEGRERVRLPAAPVEREHQLSVETLP